MNTKHCLTACAFAALLSLPGWAATPAAPTQSPAAAAVPTALDRKLAQQRTKVAGLDAKLRAEHKKLGATIGRMVDIAVSLRDTRESGTMAIQIKEAVVRDLGTIIKLYRGELTRLRQQAQNETSPAAKAVWEEQIAQGTAMVEERVDQVIRISESLAIYGEGSDSIGDRDDRVTSSAASRAERTGKAVREAVRRDKVRLEKENEQLKRDLKQAGNEEERADIEKQISENETLISKRQDQVVDVVAGASGSQRSAKRSALFDYNQELRKIMTELRSAYDDLLRLKKTADKERRALALLEDQKAAKP